MKTENEAVCDDLPVLLLHDAYCSPHHHRFVWEQEHRLQRTTNATPAARQTGAPMFAA